MELNLFRWLKRFVHREKWDDERKRELHAYLETETSENIARGMSPEAARDAARRKLGNLTQIREEIYHMNSLGFLETLLQDIRFALRMLRKNPGFTAVAVLTLALGIGANTAIFSVVNAVLLRPLPYPSPDHIVAIHGSSPINFVIQGSELHMTWSKWADNTQSFEHLAAYETGELNLAASGAEPERIAAAEVSESFFETFGLSPIAGRTFLQEEEIPNHPAVAMISSALCRRYGSPRDVIGKTLQMNGKQTVIIGVMPFGFEFPEKTLLWLPAAWNSNDEMLLKQASFYDVVGRLKLGVSTAQAREELSAIETHARAEVQKSMPGRKFSPMRKVTVVSLHDQLAGSSRPALLLLLGAVGFVLLIACADVANLLLTRAVQRQREIALRAALGASRWRLVRQGLAESVLLSAIGGAGGLVLAYWTLSAVRRFIPAKMLFVQSISLDVRVLLFLMGVSLASGLIFGVFPVLHALRVDLTEPLREGASSSPARHSFLGRTRSFLAVAEVAMALVLLAGAGLLIKSFWRLTNVETGFRRDSVLTASVTLPTKVYQKSEQRSAFVQQTLQRISAIPGVAAASYISNLPFGNAARVTFKVKLEQETPAHLAKQNQFGTFFYGAGPDYFRTMGIPLIAGREFNYGDRAGASPVVIINKTIADLFWPRENPIGRRLGIPGPGQSTPWAEIIGIVGDTKHASLDEEPSSEYYIPSLQSPSASVFLVVRASGDPGATINAIRQSVAQVDSTLPLSTFMTMTERVSESVAEPRFRTLLLGIFAGLALVLAAAGIYGVMSYSVAQRTHEIGIRMAMGADRGNILSLVLGHSLRLTMVGVAIGLAASWGLTRLLASTLYAVAPHDMATLIAVSVLLSAVALLASYIPARRAMRVDPIVALRYE